MALGNVVPVFLWACQGLIAGRCCLCNGTRSEKGKPGGDRSNASAKNRTDAAAKWRMNGEHRAGLFSRESRSEPWFLLLSRPEAWTASAGGGASSKTNTEYLKMTEFWLRPFCTFQSCFSRSKSNVSRGQRINC